MKINKISLIVVGILFMCAHALAFETKELKSFKTMSEFKTLEAFESQQSKYTQECLDAIGSGGMAYECFVNLDIWDRELNIYYKQLMAKLKPAEKELLKKSQKKWLESRDLDIALNDKMIGKMYEGSEGSMYVGMKVGDRESLQTPKIKERVLLLKAWLEMASSKPLAEELE